MQNNPTAKITQPRRSHFMCQRVAINPDNGQGTSDLLVSPNGFEFEPTPVSIELPGVVT